MKTFGLLEVYSTLTFKKTLIILMAAIAQSPEKKKSSDSSYEVKGLVKCNKQM